MFRIVSLLAFVVGTAGNAVCHDATPSSSVLQVGAERSEPKTHVHVKEHEHKAAKKESLVSEASLFEKRVKKKMAETRARGNGKNQGEKATKGEDQMAADLSNSMEDAMAASLSAVYNAEEQAHILKKQAAHDLALADELLKNVSTLSAGLQDAMSSSIKNLQKLERSADDEVQE
mmetsp:Transcript_64984/g.121003  ORF Transcript_64984/g.121003 Transcript_64984/m.121003 type:complete len:175 (-) Transcript_64984:206-730(-)